MLEAKQAYYARIEQKKRVRQFILIFEGVIRRTFELGTNPLKTCGQVFVLVNQWVQLIQSMLILELPKICIRIKNEWH